jgi:recombination protein RecT
MAEGLAETLPQKQKQNSMSSAITKDVVLSKPKDLLEFLTKSKSAIEMALPKHLNPERMMRLALTSFSSNPKLRQCTAHSILSSLVLASQVGLEPGVTGQAYLIPYGKTCTFVPGWQGLVGLLNNTGKATAWTGCVYEGDEWEFELGATPKLRQVPGENYGDPDMITWFYACGKVNGSEQPIVEAWPAARVWKHRDRYNKVGERHYSYEQPEMYGRKVLLLQVLKYLPRSVNLNNAMTAANASEMGRMAVVTDGIVVDVENLGNSDEAEPRKLENAARETSAPAAATEPAKPIRGRTKPLAAPAVTNPIEEPEPQPQQQEEPEATVVDGTKEKSDDEIRKGLSATLQDLLKENQIKAVKFESACRTAGLISASATLGGQTTAKLQLIVENAGEIIQAIIDEEEAAQGQQ